MATSSYVRKVNGGWRLTGTRVSLSSIVHAYNEGLAPEVIRAEFPSLTLEQVYGAIAFYLHNERTVNAALRAEAKLWDRLRIQSEKRNRDILARMRASYGARKG